MVHHDLPGGTALAAYLVAEDAHQSPQQADIRRRFGPIKQQAVQPGDVPPSGSRRHFIEHTLRYFRRQIELTGVDLRLNPHATVSSLTERPYDCVILATGIVPRKPNIRPNCRIPVPLRSNQTSLVFDKSDNTGNLLTLWSGSLADVLEETLAAWMLPASQARGCD